MNPFWFTQALLEQICLIADAELIAELKRIGDYTQYEVTEAISKAQKRVNGIRNSVTDGDAMEVDRIGMDGVGESDADRDRMDVDAGM